MAIQFINNQPIYFIPELPTDSECKSSNGCGSSGYCAPYEVGDPISFQFRQQPCNNSNVFCAPGLVNPNSNIVTNGDFATNSGWTFGTGWIYDGANQRVTRSGTTNSSLTQTLGSLNPGILYMVEFTMNGSLLAGNYPEMTVTLGGNPVGVPGRPFTGGGTYRVLAEAGSGSTISFTSNDELFSLDNVSVVEALIGDNDSYCLYSASPLNWQQILPNAITHIQGDSTMLETDVVVTQQNGYFKMKIRVTGMTSGTLDLWCHNTAGDIDFATITQNGDYTFYFNYYQASGSSIFQVRFQPTADFNGTLQDIELYDLSVQYPIILKSTTPGGPVYTIPSTSLYYNLDFVTVNYANIGITPGQYQIKLYDTCTVSPSMADMINDYNFANCDWTYPPTSSCVNNSYLKLNSSSQAIEFYPAPWSTTITDCVSGTFLLTFETAEWPTANTTLTLWDYVSNQPLTFPLITGISENTTYTVQFTITNPNSVSMQPYFRLTFPTAIGEDHAVVQCRVQEITSFPNAGTEYTSNCLDIRTHHKCTHWLKGTCDQQAFGFSFNNNFGIQGRVKSMFLNPKYKGELNRYADANGKFTVTRASSNKIYEFLIDYAPEHAHDWIRLAVACDTINIHPSSSTVSEWVNTQGDYQPEWPDTLGNFPLAQCRLELQQKIDELYNNNAG